MRLLEATERKARKKRNKRKDARKRRPHRAAPIQKKKGPSQSRPATRRKVQGEPLGPAPRARAGRLFSTFRLATVRSRRRAGLARDFFFFFFFFFLFSFFDFPTGARFERLLDRNALFSKKPDSTFFFPSQSKSRKSHAHPPKSRLFDFSSPIPRRTPWLRSLATLRLFDFSTFRASDC